MLQTSRRALLTRSRSALLTSAGAALPSSATTLPTSRRALLTRSRRAPLTSAGAALPSSAAMLLPTPRALLTRSRALLTRSGALLTTSRARPSTAWPWRPRARQRQGRAPRSRHCCSLECTSAALPLRHSPPRAGQQVATRQRQRRSPSRTSWGRSGLLPRRRKTPRDTGTPAPL